MNSITEEMRFGQRLCEYAMKHGVTRAQDDIIQIDSLYIGKKNTTALFAASH